MEKLFVFGIDGAMPERVFGEWLNELPNIKNLMEKGCYAKLNSTIPPLSGTAWTSIVTGKSPSEHGIFEYLFRKNFSYSEFHPVSSKNISEDTIWDILSKNSKNSISCFIPITWPPKPLKGSLITGFMTPPGENVEITYPKYLKKELSLFLGENLKIDVENFRNLTKEQIIEQVYRLTKLHIDSMRYLLEKKPWDFFIGVINGSDRINHSFWKYQDEEHFDYQMNSKFSSVLKDYYKFLDNLLGEILEIIPEDAKIIILSDHGITRMRTRVNLTDWLIKEGYLFLNKEIVGKTEFKPELVDWSKTKAFVTGAYDAEIFINLKGREPQGVVTQEEYDLLVEELENKIKSIPGEDGKTLNTQVFKKKNFFLGKKQGISPDMIVYFDNLEYGCNSTLIGNETMYSLSTAKGSDDAGHSQQGIFIMTNCKKKGNLGEIDILDVAPTILHHLNIPIPKDIQGEVIE